MRDLPLDKEDQEGLINFKNLILQALEIAREDELKNLRTLNFDNGFIEGILCSTHFLLECVLEIQGIEDVEIGLIGFHRASHTLLGELTEKDGKCGLVKKVEHQALNRLIAHEAAAGVKVINSSAAPNEKSPKPSKPN